MRPGKGVFVVNVLIAVSLAVALILGGLVTGTVTGTSPSVSIGSVVGVFSDGAMQLHVPLIVRNRGYLAIQGARLALNLSDAEGRLLIAGTSGSFDVPPESSFGQNVTLKVDLGSLPQSQVDSLLTQNQNLTLSAGLKASLPPLASLTGTATGELAWGAVLNDLNFSQGTMAGQNSTCSLVSWLMSFTNSNQYFHLDGNMTGTVIDQSGAVVGSIVPLSFQVERGGSFVGVVNAVVQDSALQGGGGNSIDLSLSLNQSSLFSTHLMVEVDA